MNTSTLHAIRAIGALQLHRFTRISTIITLLIVVTITTILSWLSFTYSEWWWVFVLPLFVAFAIVAIILTVLWATSYLIMPRELSKLERRQINSFLDRLFVAAADAQVSRSTLAFIIIRDAIKGMPFGSRVQSVVDEGFGLRNDFLAITKLF